MCEFACVRPCIFGVAVVVVTINYLGFVHMCGCHVVCVVVFRWAFVLCLPVVA